jgi:succinoglycan biosynthesis transport protein ExoP
MTSARQKGAQSSCAWPLAARGQLNGRYCRPPSTARSLGLLLLPPRFVPANAATKQKLTLPDRIDEPRKRDSVVEEALRVLRRRFFLVALCTIGVAGAALAFSFTQEKKYTASAQLLFRDPGFDQKLFGSTLLPPGGDAGRQAATNVRLVSLRVVADRTAQVLGNGMTGSKVAGMVAVASDGQSDVVSIKAEARDPQLAARLANTFARQYIGFRRASDRATIREARALVARQLLQRRTNNQINAPALRKQIDQLDLLESLQTGNAELVQPAQAPGVPSSPRILRNSVIGGLLGLALGIGFAFLYDRLDRRMREPADIEEVFARPIIGSVPFSRAIASSRSPIPQSAQLDGSEAEAFRMLRANLRYFNSAREIKSVLITSGGPSEGKTTVAWNLAIAATQSGNRTLLIEADLRRPRLTQMGSPGERPRGLSQVLANEVAFDQALTSVPVRDPFGEDARLSLSVLLAGPIPPNPGDLLESARMAELIRHAEQDFDLVVIDSAPIAVVSDAVPLLRRVGGVLLVAWLGRTRRDAAGALTRQLDHLGVHALGVVVNGIKNAGKPYGYYGYVTPETAAPAGSTSPEPAEQSLANS